MEKIEYFVELNFFGMDVEGVWKEGEKGGVLWWIEFFLERGRDGVLVVVLDGT